MEGNDAGQVEPGVVGLGVAPGPGAPVSPPESGERLPPIPLSAEGEPTLASLLRPAAPGDSTEGIARSEALDGSCEPCPGGGAVALACWVVALVGRPAAKLGIRPPPEGTAIQTRNATVAAPAATALDLGPLDAPRHHKRKAVKGPSRRLMDDLCSSAPPSLGPSARRRSAEESRPTTAVLRHTPWRSASNVVGPHTPAPHVLNLDVGIRIPVQTRRNPRFCPRTVLSQSERSNLLEGVTGRSVRRRGAAACRR